MIRTKKTCSVEGCTWPVFGRGFCSSHYKSQYLAPRQMQKPREFVFIKRRTKDRVKEERKYLSDRQQFIEDLRAKDPQKKVYCIFCGKPIYSEPDLHHANGRDGDKLLNQNDWFLAHQKCHCVEYHGTSWEKLSWWNDYLERIKDSHPHIYQKEMLRMEKSNIPQN